MPRTKRVLELLTVAVLLCGLAGCPLFFPVLQVTPTAVRFDPTDEIRVFRVSNGGGGTLNWEATTEAPGVFMTVRQEPAKQGSSSVSGSVTNTTDIVEIRVNRELLPETGAKIEVSSNGGSETVLLTASNVIEGRATIALSTNALDFGLTETQLGVSISNRGSLPLEWLVESKPDWVTVVPAAGTVLTNQPRDLTVRVNRNDLVPGDYAGTIMLNSNAGPAEIAVTMSVPPFFASPNVLDFGTISTPANLNLDVTSNMPDCPGCANTEITVLTSTESGTQWFSMEVGSLSLAPTTSTSLNVSADPMLVEPGAHVGEIVLRDDATGFEFVVEVRMTRSSIAVAPPLIDFGGIFTPETATFTVTNVGNTPQNYNLVPPTGQQNWLNIAPDASNDTPPGSVAPGETDTFIVTANPTNVLAGTYTADIVVTFQGGQATVRVIMVAEKAAVLIVTPQNVNFATTRIQESVGIINGGTTGTINWSINTNNFPAWLSLRPVGGGGIASGTLSGGNSAQSVILEVDRDQIPDDTPSTSFSFDVVGTGDVNQTETVNVTIGKVLTPTIIVEGQTTSNEGVEQVIFPETVNTRTFTVRNEGLGALEWNVIGILDPNDPNGVNILPLPSWIQGIEPGQDTLDPNIQQTVTINVTRAGLNFLGARATLIIASNDPDRPRVPLFVEVIVPRVPVIGSRPATVSFGIDTVSSIFEVANLGDPGTELVYTVTANKDWVSFFPTSGRSIGTDLLLKDWKTHSISVDRSQLTEAGDSATLTIRAIRPGTLDEIDTSIEPRTVNVVVQVPQLAIETPRARQRIPSLMRHVMTLRNLRSQVISLSEANMSLLQNGVSIIENDQAIEISETEVFIKKATPARINTNVLILLDYSASMQLSASLDPDETISGAADPLQALYERSIGQLIENLPGEYRVGLAIFNERSAFSNPVRGISTSSVETLETDGNLFIQDKDVLLQRLNDINVVDNGATELLPALLEASFMLYEQDFYDNLYFPFDDADVRALICVTDGRLTTPPGPLGPVSQLMEDLRIKFLPVSWGDQVQNTALIELMAASGGHLYTANRVTVVDENTGNISRVPSVTALERWMTLDPNDPCDQSIPKDLDNQVLLSYVSLNEESGTSVKVNLSFNDPNDTLDPSSGVAGCLEDQGVISNSVEYPGYPMFNFAGDVNLGQIYMHTAGIQEDGSGVEFADVFVNLDAAPRNITSLQFTFGLENDPPEWDPTGLVLTPAVVALPEGGLVANWNSAVAGQTLTLTSPNGTPLRYGDHGRLFKATVRHVDPNVSMQDFRLNLDINAPVFSTGAVNEKYFTAPDSIMVRHGEEFKATSFPRTAFLNFDPAPFSTRPFQINLGANEPFVRLDLANLGGSHFPTAVWLNMSLSLDSGSDSAFISSTETFPTTTPVNTILVSTYDLEDVYIYPNRCQQPGAYIAKIIPEFNFGSIGMSGQAPPIYVHYAVTGIPELEVTPADTEIVLGPSENNYTLTVANVGQGVLVWSIDTQTFPDWLRVTANSGELSACDTFQESFNLVVDRSVLGQTFPPPHTFTINSNGGTFTATVELSAGALSITPDISDINVTGPNAVFPIQLFNFGDAVAITWEVENPNLLPAWLSFSQNSGTLDPLEQLTVDINVTGATPLPVSQNFRILSEGQVFQGRITVNP